MEGVQAAMTTRNLERDQWRNRALQEHDDDDDESEKLEREV